MAELPTTPGVADEAAEIADAGTPAEVAAEATPTETTPIGTEATPAATTEEVPVTPTVAAPTTTTAVTSQAGSTVDDLVDRARQSGFDETMLQEGIDSYERGIMDIEYFERWIDRVTAPEDAVETAIAGASDDTVVETESPVTAPTAEETIEAAQSEYEATMAGITDTYAQSQEALATSAEERYAAQVASLDSALALQQELAAQQQALIASATELQRETLQSAYDSSLAAAELQRTRVAEAYAEMQEEQALLNTQSTVRQETALGLIYGGFGSVAANRNLEETILRGERTLMNLGRDAINADTDIQNQIIDLTTAYELDTRAIDQWNAEQSMEVYSALSSYVQEITADMSMAAVEKDAAIRESIADYNTMVAEINAATAETRLNLALEMMNRADMLQQQEFNNQITAAQEERAAEAYEYEQNRTVINDARTDLDLLLSTYFDQDYDTLPADVLAQIAALEETAQIPDGAGRSIMEAARENEARAGEIVQEYTNSVTGEVTAVRYNFDTGVVETMQLGALEDADPVASWTSLGTDEDGNIVTLNEVTGEVRTQGQYSGQSGTPLDALAVPDYSYGGQCGHFVNQYTGLGMGDSYESKLSVMDSSITTPEAGMVFVMPYRDTGHTGFIVSVNEETGMATVRDSNWYVTSDPEAVRTHEISIASMTGFLDVGAGATASSATSAPAASTEEEEDTGYTPLFE